MPKKFFLCVALGAFAIVAWGAWNCAMAQEDGCRLNVIQTPQGAVNGGCFGYCPNGGTCTTVQIPDGYGNLWTACMCDSYTPEWLCVLGWLPFDPNNPTFGQARCFPLICQPTGCELVVLGDSTLDCFCFAP